MRTVRVLAACALALALASCAAIKAHEADTKSAQLHRESDAAAQQCNAKYGSSRKNAVALMRCLNDAEMIIAPDFDPDQDLWRLFLSQRLVVAEQLQNGTIDGIKASAIIDSNSSAMMSELQRRQEARQSVAAQQEAASAQEHAAFSRARHSSFSAPGVPMPPSITLSAPAIQAPPQPAVMAFPAPIPTTPQTTCTTFGNTTRCY